MHGQYPCEQLDRFFIFTSLRGDGGQQLKRIKITGIDAHDFFINGSGLIEISRLMQRQPLLQRRSYHTRCRRGNGGPQPWFSLGSGGLPRGIWRFLGH